MTGIRELQFFQEREGELIVKIAKAPTVSESELAEDFLKEIYKQVDEKEFDVRIDFVDQVARTKGGKLKLLEQRLPIEFQDL